MPPVHRNPSSEATAAATTAAVAAAAAAGPVFDDVRSSHGNYRQIAILVPLKADLNAHARVPCHCRCHQHYLTHQSLNYHTAVATYSFSRSAFTYLELPNAVAHDRRLLNDDYDDGDGDDDGDDGDDDDDDDDDDDAEA